MKKIFDSTFPAIVIIYTDAVTARYFNSLLYNRAQNSEKLLDSSKNQMNSFLSSIIRRKIAVGKRNKHFTWCLNKSAGKVRMSLMMIASG